jgi:X-X-X-Leu-X-X-Gly heptad repeat protein
MVLYAVKELDNGVGELDAGVGELNKRYDKLIVGIDVLDTVDSKLELMLQPP